MKVEFSLDTDFVPEWKGNKDGPPHEQFKVVCSAVSTTEMLELFDAMQQAGLTGNDTETTEIKGHSASILLAQAKSMLPKHCKFIGLEDSDGEVNADRVVEFPFYTDLAVEVLLHLAGLLAPDEEDSKNLKAPLDGPQSQTGGASSNDSPE